MPQIAYYVSAYADLVAAGGVVAGKPVDICVPTGNFGNILGAYYAKKIGVPIGRMIVASNENRVLSDFIATGLYDISQRQFVTTPSPSMDILISSNLERLLYEITRDSDIVAEWMRSLASTGRFKVDPETFRQIRELFSADKALAELPYDEVLPDGIRELSGVELLNAVQELAGEGQYIPKALGELDDLPERFTNVVSAGRESVEGAVRTWLG